ncbi:FHIP family protein AAEL005291 isoform X2 [Aphidius gifuensis]|uniref:FHIP family protein AAEL005291 isoform X2 n=1 Tax=Aphidius gifuensis TaxID=684658 RepID=UPI001CDD52B6|nr:FHIP family protein AAEL005291 isoform X2 [Aphidius gifuensis]
MSWLRSSPLRNSFGKQWSRDSPPKDADPSACYDSFCKHWQQTYEIIKQINNAVPIHDDILAVVNHIDQMVTLLLLEFRNTIGCSHQQNLTTTAPSHSPCLEYLLSENLLDILYEWSKNAGRYSNTLRLEQMKLFEILVSYNGSLLAHEPVARPLLLLLEACDNDILPSDVEKKLIVLLNTLCVALMQNLALLDVFFHPTANGNKKFIIFSLLVPHVHRDGAIGQQTRDAMLLCMALSKKNHEIGVYIAENSNVCPVLATGISGLYSVIPRKLDIETDDWHRLTPDDVNDISSLDHLMHSFEFCNAVAQISHPLVQKQLLEYLYQGFLVPVMGPALLQNSLDDLVSATAYFDLFLRSVTDPGLLHTLIKFLLEDNYDECRILDSLIQRISSRSRLCIVTLALFETLVDLNCEDIMLELCLSSLTPCSHVMLSQRRRLRDHDSFGSTAKKFLSLRPACCLDGTWLHNFIHRSSSKQDKTTNSLMVNYGAKVTESLYGNYHAYLFDAKQKIISCQIGCSYWSSNYDGINNTVDDIDGDCGVSSLNTNYYNKKLATASVVLNKLSDDDVLSSVKSLVAANDDDDDDDEDSTNINVNIEDDNMTFNNLLISDNNDKLDADIDELLNEEIIISKLSDDILRKNCETNVQIDSMFSLDDSSGYESLALKNIDDLTIENETDNKFDKNNITNNYLYKKNNVIDDNNKLSKQDLYNGKPTVGIFLDVILRKLETMLSNNLYVNLHLTGLISRLAVYRQPLLQSFLLNPSLVFQPSIRSLFQILASLKNKIDQHLSKVENVDDLIAQARNFLIAREYKLVNARRNAINVNTSVRKDTVVTDPFIRNKSKRKSLTTSLSHLFKWSGASSLQSTLQNNRESDEHLENSNDNNIENRFNVEASSMMSLQKTTPTQHVVICAVLMDEWLKELAAITQEHLRD